MLRKRSVRRAVVLALLALACAALLPFLDRPEQVQPVGERAAEFEAMLNRMIALESALLCDPGLDEAVLDEVLADSTDYRITAPERAAIENAYGRAALRRAGYRTARKALIFARRHPAPSTPPAGLRPTPAPVIVCSGKTLTARLTGITLYGEDRVVVQYETANGCTYTAALRSLEDGWRVTAVKIHGSCGT